MSAIDTIPSLQEESSDSTDTSKRTANLEVSGSTSELGDSSTVGGSTGGAASRGSSASGRSRSVASADGDSLRGKRRVDRNTRAGGHAAGGHNGNLGDPGGRVVAGSAGRVGSVRQSPGVVC